MDVQSPLTGRCYYKVDVDALVLILIDAGIVTPLRAAQQTPAPQPPKVDTWAVALIGNATPVIILTRPSGETVRYGEDPDSAIKVFARIGAKLPQDVYEKYALQFPQARRP